MKIMKIKYFVLAYIVLILLNGCVGKPAKSDIEKVIVEYFTNRVTTGKVTIEDLQYKYGEETKEKEEVLRIVHFDAKIRTEFGFIDDEGKIVGGGLYSIKNGVIYFIKSGTSESWVAIQTKIKFNKD